MASAAYVRVVASPLGLRGLSQWTHIQIPGNTTRPPEDLASTVNHDLEPCEDPLTVDNHFATTKHLREHQDVVGQLHALESYYMLPTS